MDEQETFGKTPERSGAALTVISFNVRFSTAEDGANAWAFRKAAFGEVVRNHEVDLLGVQECLAEQAAYICECVPAYRWFGTEREADGTGEMSALFYRHERFTPLRAGNLWLSETPDILGSRSWNTECTRMATWAQLHDLDRGGTLWFVNTHLDHQSAAARLEAARLLVERIDAMAANAPVVVTGDFNSDGGEGSPAWRVFKEAGFDDAWTAADAAQGDGYSYHGFEAPIVQDQGRIDWILARGGLVARSAALLTDHADGQYPSDHFPVLAQLTYA